MATYTSADELDLASITKRYGFDDISLEPLNGGAFPDVAKSQIHEELIGFVQSLDSFDARAALRGERR